jgi:protein TonB
VDRFASHIADRFPPVSAKYESRPLAAPAVQRAEMPVADGGAQSTQTENFTPMFAESVEPAFDEMPPINFAPGDSVASQLASRLQSFRQADAPVVQPRPGRGQPSPREISRKAAAVAQRRTAEQPKLRRASVEEIGAKPPEPTAAKEVESTTAPSTNAPEAIQRETIESKPESKPRPGPQSAPSMPKPTRLTAPVEAASAPQRAAAPVQRRPILSWDEGASETIEPGPNPEKPSVFEALAQRLAESRFETQWESPSSEPGEPSTPAPTRESRPLVQRKPATHTPRPAAAPEPPPAIVQRAEVEPESVSEELPLVPQPIRDSPRVEPIPESEPIRPAVRPAVQRQVEESSAPAPVEKPETEKKAAVPAKEIAPRPVVRRTPEPAPGPLRRPPTELRVEESSERPDDSEQSRPRAEVLSQPATQPAQPPAIQRETEAAPPRRGAEEVEPGHELPPPSESIRTRAESALKLPLAQPPTAVQRKPAEVRAEPPGSRAAEVVSREPGGEVEEVESVAPSPREPVERALPLARRAVPMAVQRMAEAEKVDRPQIQPALSESSMGVMQRVAESPARPRPAPPSLPLAANVSRAPAAVQRANGTGSVTTEAESRGSEVVEEQRPAAAQDLHALARKIYPLLKRMLAIERERR